MPWILSVVICGLRSQMKGNAMQKYVKLLLLLVVLLHSEGVLRADKAIFSEDAVLETLFMGGVLTEGVVAAPDGTIYFSDITFTATSGMQAGHLMKYGPKTGEVTVYRSPSGMSNGIKFDAEGHMVIAEGADFGGRRVIRTDLKTGKSVIIADFYENRRFNAPNDISIDLLGRIYFSDPRYVGHESMEQGVMAVYRIDLDGSIHQIITDAGKPNGVCVSPDQKTLYVVSNDNGSTDMFRFSEGVPFRKGRMALLAYDLNPDGTAKFRKTLVNYFPQDGPDGLVVDVEGNLYVAVRDKTRPGIYVYSPEGKELAYLRTPDLPTNVGFGRGEEKKILYITAGGNLHRIKTYNTGYHLPTR